MISKIECKQHSGKEVLYICTDQYCTADTRCCEECISNLHNVHQDKIVHLSSVQDFISRPESIHRQTKDLQTAIQQLQQIRQYLTNINQLIDDKLKQIEDKLFKTDINLQNLLENGSPTLQLLKILLNQYIIQDNQIMDLNEQMKQKMHQQTNYLFQQINHTTQEFSKKLKQYLSKLSIDLYKEENTFSYVSKHQHIQISERRTATLTQQIGYGVVFGDQGFNPIKESFKCQFIINRLSYGLVGFGELEQSKNNGYQIYDFSQGHGFYVLHNSGVVYNSDDGQINNTKLKNLTFEANDIITCQYDAQSKQVTFIKESQQDAIFQMKISTQQILYPVAILFGPGESISFA